MSNKVKLHERGMKEALEDAMDILQGSDADRIEYVIGETNDYKFKMIIEPIDFNTGVIKSIEADETFCYHGIEEDS